MCFNEWIFFSKNVLMENIVVDVILSRIHFDAVFCIFNILFLILVKVFYVVIVCFFRFLCNKIVHSVHKRGNVNCASISDQIIRNNEKKS